jgi:hypothetical protein
VMCLVLTNGSTEFNNWSEVITVGGSYSPIAFK